jgi:hypothetical protein
MNILVETQYFFWRYIVPATSRQQVLSFLVSCVSPVELSDGRRIWVEGRGKEPYFTTARKPGPLKSIKYSLLREMRKEDAE